MTKADFNLQMTRLTRVHGKRGFEEDRVSSIWKICGHLSAYEFSRIVDSMISDFRYAPLPKDFREASQRLTRFRSEDHDPDPIPCRKCLDSGLIEAHQEELEFTAFIRCDCEYGINNALAKGLPIINDEIRSTHKFSSPTLSDWKPGEGETLWTKARSWRGKIEESENYWQ